MFDEIENLRILRIAEELSDSIWNIVIKWDSFAKFSVGKQLVQATDSIGANIAESQGRIKPPDVKHFLYYARGSYQEMKYWLRRSYKRNLITKDKYFDFIKILDGFIPQLNSFIAFQEKRNQSNQLTNKPTSKHKGGE